LSDTKLHALASTNIVDLTHSGADTDRHVLIPATIGLETGKTYYVEKIDNDNFHLAATPGGVALAVSSTEVTGTHSIGREGIELNPATGFQSLYIDFTSQGGDGQELLGP